MVATKITAFGGMIPAQDSVLLPSSNASQATDIWVATGALEGFWQPKLLYTAISVDTRRIFRIPTNYYTKEHLEDAFFMEFTDQNTDVLHAPMADDVFDRYYWAAPTIVPQYNTKDRILAGDPSYVLGVPVPEHAPTITLAANEGLTADPSTYGVTGYPALMWVSKAGGVVITDSGDENTAPPFAAVPGGLGPVIEARSYVYTWVTEYGEEGPPSPPVVQTGGQLTNWRITITPPTPDDLLNRALESVNIYRTVTGTDGSASYYLVDNVPLSTTVYLDDNGDVDIIGGQTLQSGGWTAPPEDLEGWVMMANGMIAGFRSNEIWFCEPYRPHAWPVAYTILTQHPIVGMGVVNSTLVICTVSEPYTASGGSPGAMTMVKIDAVEPCLSRASIVATPDGIIYASQNGLVMASPMYGVVRNITDKLITKDQWLDIFDMPKLCAARLGALYFGMGVMSDGCFEPTAFDNTNFEMLDYTDSQVGFTIATADQRVAMSMLTSDAPTHSVQNDVWTGEVIVQQGQQFYWIDQSEQNPRRPYKWTSKTFQLDVKDNFAAMRVFWQAGNTPAPYLPRNEDINMVFDGQMYGVVRVFCNGRLVMSREMRTPAELWRLPSGFKGEFWWIEVEARVTVKNIQLASTAKELASV